MKKITALVCILFCIACEQQEGAQKGTFTDTRESKVYKTVKVNGQVWMAENLNYNASGSKCYDNNLVNYDKYGRLYNWETAMKSCPSGWHLPNKAEWEVLMATVGGETTEEQFGFFALPGGYGYSSGYFYDVGNLSYWWSANEYDSYSAYRRHIYYINEYSDDNSYVKNLLRSVRCVQD
jgi:Fibrobacter succinogenes major domain (Fib_succ_major).